MSIRAVYSSEFIVYRMFSLFYKLRTTNYKLFLKLI
jgi:hypothetical protein